MQADLLIKIILPLALFLIMFGLGLSLKPTDFKTALSSPKAMSIGLFGQLILLPLLALSIAWALKLPAEISVGLMIIALAPGGVTSNMLTYLFKGDVSLSISLTAVVSIITPFTIPLGITVATQIFMDNQTSIELSPIKTFTQLIAITLFPVSLGMLVLSRWHNLAQKMEAVLKWFSILFLFLIITLIVIKNADNMQSFFAQAGLASFMLNISAIAIGYGLAKLGQLNHPQSVCIGLEVGIQNGTLALVVSGTLMANTTMMIPAITYSLLMFITGAVFGWWIKHKPL